MTDIQRHQVIIKKGSFSAMAWAIGKLKGVEEIIAITMLD